MYFDLPQPVAARTREICAGRTIGSGTTRIEMQGASGRAIFGVIDQTVVRYVPAG